MSTTTAVDGVVAAGRVPTWIIQPAQIPTDPTDGTWSIPLAALTHESTVKIDCFFDFGDVQVNRSPITRTRQRVCEVNPQNREVGETIDITIAAVYDQQALMTATVNEAYSAMPKGASVYIAQAFGWDQSATPTVATVIDLIPGTVQSRLKNQPATPDEDLKFTATISAREVFEDVALAAA